MKPAVPWGTALRIARRELQASRAKFLFVIFAVAIGVGALTGVRGFSQSFQKALLGKARSLLAADLAARMFHEATPKQVQAMNALATDGVERTQITQTVSMASLVQAGANAEDATPVLVSLKAVNPGKYPFYGKLVLKPEEPLQKLLTDKTVLVDDNLLVRLRAKVGDELTIGGQEFRIAAEIVSEPDRLTAGLSIGPRVMMTRQALMGTGLVQPGSQASERYLFKLPQGSDMGAMKSRLKKILPDAEVTDFRDANPALTRGLKHATGLLSLICLVAMVLGAIGVGMAMRAHLQQRIEVLAIMKSIGARSRDILRIYLLQTVLLGVGGALLGIFLGVGVEYALPAMLGKLLPLHPVLTLPVGPVLAAFGTGILTTVLFCLPPLLDVRKIRPVVVLRRTVSQGEPGRGVKGWVLEHRLQLASMVVILAGLGGIAAGLANSVMVGKWFTICLAALLVVLLGLTAGMLRLLRSFLAKTRLRLPSTLRHGLANLYRPGNQSAAVLAALGAGVMLILSVFLMQGSIVASLRADAPPSAPNVFLVDISNDELEGVKQLVEAQKGIRGKVETVPIVQGHIAEVNGVAATELEKNKKYPRYLFHDRSFTWMSKLPPDTKISEGKWWTSDDAKGVALVDWVAKDLKVHPGAKITFDLAGTKIATQVAAVFALKGQHSFARADFIMPPNMLKQYTTIWYGDAHVRPSEIPQLERAVFAKYPTVTVVNVADIMDTISKLVDQIAVVIHFLAGFSIFSGLIILASSVASTRFRRIREVVVLKTLGARRRRIATVFSIEFTVLGLMAGVVGAVFANVLSRILLHRMHVPFTANYVGSVVAVVAAAVLAVVTGWVASYRILGQRPLEVLREE
jgi:putative ABC transport system permease protein